MKYVSTGRLVLLAAACAIAIGAGTPSAHAGGGLAIGKVADDLVERFNRAADPTPPVSLPQPKLEYTPPERVPGGSTTFSTGNAGSVGRLESPTSTFNRHAGDRPASSSLTDRFNHTGRGNN